MTAPAALLQQAENTAIRLLHDAYSLGQVVDRTGLPEAAIRRLAADFPGSRRQTGPAPAAGQIHELPVRVLIEHPANVRQELEDLGELTATIREHGIIQPLTVTRAANGQYVVIDGHRRLAAAIAAGLPRVPVTLRGKTSLDEALRLMLVTGLQKVNLHPLDEAAAYQKLLDLGHTRGQIATAMGKDAGHISQRLALTHLTTQEQDAVRAGDVSLHQAYLTGRDRAKGRRKGPQKRPKPKNAPHFTARHPLAETAQAICDHDTLLKITVACGPCWELAIRSDALRHIEKAS